MEFQQKLTHVQLALPIEKHSQRLPLTKELLKLNPYENDAARRSTLEKVAQLNEFASGGFVMDLCAYVRLSW